MPLVLNLNQPSSHYQVGFKIGGKDISQLCYSADTTLIVENIYDLEAIVMKVKTHYEKVGLRLNIKTKVMTTGRANSLTNGNEVIEGMDSFEILD